MTHEEVNVWRRKAEGMPETNLADLSVGTVFHVVNGNWWGEIINVDDKKAIRFLPSGVSSSVYGERHISTYDTYEIKASSMAAKSDIKIIEAPYMAVIDEIRRYSIEDGRNIV